VLRKPVMKAAEFGGFEPLDLAPVIVCEHTQTGWRGLTKDGEILNVSGHVNGSQLDIPPNLAITRGGNIIGYHAIDVEPHDGVIADYLEHLNAATALVRDNDALQALKEIDCALTCAATVLARYNRAMILLQLGRWDEGFAEWADCEQTSPLFRRPQYVKAIEHGLQPWRGEEIAGKKLLLIHDHGFGDTIMMLRLVPLLNLMGAEVVLQLPQELERLAAQVAPVTRDLVDADFVCSILMLLAQPQLGDTKKIMASAPYLQVDTGLQNKWLERLGSHHRRIGIAWSVGVDHKDDFPRTIPVAYLAQELARDGELITVQQPLTGERFEDFADCAALMSLLDEIVTVDTAAVHLAGAIGHPRITLLLSHWSSWRWRLPLYRNLHICQQETAGDWASALAARKAAP
jgi:hypothetical protein